VHNKDDPAGPQIGRIVAPKREIDFRRQKRASLEQGLHARHGGAGNRRHHTDPIGSAQAIAAAIVVGLGPVGIGGQERERRAVDVAVVLKVDIVNHRPAGPEHREKVGQERGRYRRGHVLQDR